VKKHMGKVWFERFEHRVARRDPPDPAVPRFRWWNARRVGVSGNAGLRMRAYRKNKTSRCPQYGAMGVSSG
jgi:hypothetical protein